MVRLVFFWFFSHLKRKLERNITMAKQTSSAPKNTVSVKPSNPNTHHYDKITAGLFDILDPYVSAVDSVPASRQTESADTGHAKKSTQDMSIRMFLGTVLSYANRQLKGPIKGKNGQTYASALELMRKNELQLDSIKKQFETGKDEEGRTLTTQGEVRLYEELETRLYYHRRNEAWVNFLQEIIGSFNTVHDEICGESWKSQVTPEEEKASVYKQATDTERAAMREKALEALAKIKAA